MLKQKRRSVISLRRLLLKYPPRRALLRTLINPRADNADFLSGEFGIFLFLRRRHKIIRIAEESDIRHEETFLAFTGFQDFAIHAALERSSERVEPKFALGFFRPMAIHAGFIEKRFDVFFESQDL